MSFGMSEPGGGTDVLALKTRASLQGGEWVVRGQKLYTSFADDADAILVLCRTDAGAENKRSRGLSLILTPRRPARRAGAAPGADGPARRLHLRSVPRRRARAGRCGGRRAGRGWHTLLRTLDEERILCAAMYVGITAAALDQALQYARDRNAFGRPIGTFQAVQHPLAETAIELEQIRLLTAKAAWLQSHGRDCAHRSRDGQTRRKRDRGARHRPLACACSAATAWSRRSPMERLFRDARLGPFSPISNEMVKNFVGERLGLPRSY